MVKNTVAVLLVLLIISLTFIVSAETVPYQSYNYDYYGNAAETPTAYKPVVNHGAGDQLTGMLFNQPADLFVAQNGNIYVLDSGNSKIEIFNSSFAHIKTIDGFMKGTTKDTFNMPEGIFVTSKGDIYIADTKNNRIVILNETGELKSYIVNMNSDILGDDFEFLPSKLTVDNAGRLYVVARHVFQGIMVFEMNNRFSNYIGTVNVTVSPMELFWKRFSTKSQREKSKLFVPTEFSNLDIDSEGFIYASNLDKDSNQMIKRLNPYGQDVLKNFTEFPLAGDIKFSSTGDLSGATQFCDITVRESGMYSALDSVRGRIFTYDSEGHILYIFGGFGTQIGSFKKPVAIDTSGNLLLVLDQDHGKVMAFEPTVYGSLIEGAVTERFLGNDEKSIEYWKQVLTHDANFELAYVGIGQSLLAEYKNKEAMDYLKKGHDTKYYSIAFKRHRLDLLKSNINIIFNVLAALLFLTVVLFLMKKIKNQRTNSQKISEK